MKRLSGVNALLMTPFTATEEVDENSLRREIDHVIDAEVNSVVAMGRAGEYEYLTMEERRRIMGVVVGHVAGRASWDRRHQPDRRRGAHHGPMDSRRRRGLRDVITAPRRRYTGLLSQVGR